MIYSSQYDLLSISIFDTGTEKLYCSVRYEKTIFIQVRENLGSTPSETGYLGRFLTILFRQFGLFSPKDNTIIWLSYLLTMSRRYEGYFRNALCALY